MDNEAKRQTIARNFRALRHALKLKAADVSRQSNGALSTSELTKIETGKSLAITMAKRTALAKAYRLPVPVIEALIDDRIAPNDAAKLVQASDGTLAFSVAAHLSSDAQGDRLGVLARLGNLEHARFPNLEVAILYHERCGKRWSDETLRLARSGEMIAEERSPKDWEDALDRLERLRHELAVRPETEEPGKAKPVSTRKP